MNGKLRGDWLLSAVLSTTAGAVDVIGFLALGGLFTAHITGNVVILAAHYVTGGFSEVGPLLSVPVFVAVLGHPATATERLAAFQRGWWIMAVVALTSLVPLVLLKRPQRPQ